MKLYKFYRKYSKKELANAGDLSLEDKYPLYAFTADKNLRKRFFEIHSKKCFIEIESDVEKDEYVEFANHNSGSMIAVYEYKTCNGTPCEENEINCEIVSTWMEREYISECIDNDTGVMDFIKSSLSHISPYIFLDEYLVALRVLQFVRYWICCEDKLYQDIPSEPAIESAEIPADFEYPHVEYDTVCMFIEEYRDVID